MKEYRSATVLRKITNYKQNNKRRYKLCYKMELITPVNIL